MLMVYGKVVGVDENVKVFGWGVKHPRNDKLFLRPTIYARLPYSPNMQSLFYLVLLQQSNDNCLQE